MTVEDEVRAVSAAWDEALISNDAPVVASFMTDDWVYVGPDGVTPKADIIGWIASGRLAHHRMTVVGDDRVVRAGDAVLVTARKASSGAWDGVGYTADEWISEVYVRTDGRWRCVLSRKPRSPPDLASGTSTIPPAGTPPGGGLHLTGPGRGGSWSPCTPQ